MRPSANDQPVVWHATDAAYSLYATLRPLVHGTGDLTTVLDRQSFTWATYTPHGTATLRLTWANDLAVVGEHGLTANTWGDGAEWLSTTLPGLIGVHDEPMCCSGGHTKVERALRQQTHRRMTATANPYHHVLPTVLGQRVTVTEAFAQWRRLCHELGEPPPGPARIVDKLRTPPNPNILAATPEWRFHSFGTEASRSRALRAVAKHAAKLWRWSTTGELSAKLPLIEGIGPWTTGHVVSIAQGDPDAVVVGDYHYPNAIAHVLSGEARADDDRMLELLEPYRPQRGRVLNALLATYGGAPKFGPRKRIYGVRPAQSSG